MFKIQYLVKSEKGCILLATMNKDHAKCYCSDMKAKNPKTKTTIEKKLLWMKK